MTKIRTIEHLQQLLDDELAWRKKELAVIKSLITARSSYAEIINCHIRSGIALVYAHWEGFIKEAGNAYLTYIASQKLTYLELANNFIAIAAKRLLNDARDSNKMVIYAKVVELFMSGLTDRCNLPTEIETKSNLSSEVLREIAVIFPWCWQFWPNYPSKSKRHNILHRGSLSRECASSQATPNFKDIRLKCRMILQICPLMFLTALGFRQYMAQRPILSLNINRTTI